MHCVCVYTFFNTLFNRDFFCPRSEKIVIYPHGKVMGNIMQQNGRLVCDHVFNLFTDSEIY